MHSYTSTHSSRQGFGARQDGVALIVTLLIMMLVSALMVGFVAAVIADQRASGLDRDQTQAYAAAHAGMEQLSSDLSNLFITDFSPNATQLAALRANTPSLPGFTFVAPGGGSNSGYMVEPKYPDGSGNPLPENTTEGSMITVGPFQGFKGIITPYDITITARSNGSGGAEVRMKRTLQTVAIPVFQFGMFSETDLAFHAGAEAFTFGGRVHTNGNLFLAAATGGSLTIWDRITAVGEIVRSNLPNGLAVGTGYTGNVRIPTTIASNPNNNVYRNLASNEGSLTGTIPKTTTPNNENPTWYGLSTGTYKSNIRNGTTGAKRLDLPLVADLDNNGQPDAQPIELIRRPAQGPPFENATNPIVYLQRYFAQASVRILLSDTAAEIQSLPTVLPPPSAPVALFGPLTIDNYFGYLPAAPTATQPPLGSYETPGVVNGNLPGSVYKGVHNESVLGGFIKIEMQKQDGTWQDVTGEILSLGIAGRNLADADQAVASRWNNTPDSAADTCAEPNPNAIIRLQRVRDIPIDLAPCGIDTDVAGNITGNVSSVSGNDHDYWPNVLYDTREAQFRDGLNSTDLSMLGIIHYVELDVNNLRRWLLPVGSAGKIGTNGHLARNDNGFIIYFSDRRNNKDESTPPRETGELGFEDVTNPATAGGAPNGALNPGEDLNANGTLELYGRIARNWAVGSNTLEIPTPAANGWPNPFYHPTNPNNLVEITAAITDANVGIGQTVGTGANQVPATVPAFVKPLVARANRTMFFRRALKLVNGGLGSLPTAGFTVVAENPVYVQGNYNATAASVTGAGSAPAAIIADAVTLLSNNWNDIRSFTSPTDSTGRKASLTGYRLAIVTGKGLYFPQPAGTDASFGSDGGAHNFMRSLEDWDEDGVIHRYRGSLVSFFINRQGVGTFKCCDSDAYVRGDREWTFDTDFLLPTRLPPGTPMFRDVNTLTFRQLLRPTQ